MPDPHEKGTPGEKGAHSKLPSDLSLDREADENDQDSPLAQAKRRREAALRLQPLPTGFRDPQFGFQRDGVAS